MSEEMVEIKRATGLVGLTVGFRFHGYSFVVLANDEESLRLFWDKIGMPDPLDISRCKNAVLFQAPK